MDSRMARAAAAGDVCLTLPRSVVSQPSPICLVALTRSLEQAGPTFALIPATIPRHGEHFLLILPDLSFFYLASYTQGVIWFQPAVRASHAA